MTCSNSATPGAFASVHGPQSARPIPSETVELPRHVLAAAQFSLAQVAARLERVVCSPPSKIDAAILAGARGALLAVQAAIELDRARR